MARRWVWVAAVAVGAWGCGGGGGSGDGDAGQDAADGGGGSCTEDSDCDDGIFCNGPEACLEPAGGGEPVCVRSGAACPEGQTCDEDARSCMTDCGAGADADGDGHDAAACGGDDCDDGDANRFPGNTEVCDEDAHDEDCDPTTVGMRDGDGDGFVDASCCNPGSAGDLACGADCDDSNASASPTGTEVCNGVDDDCDGDIDEGVLVPAYPDVDGDGRGDESATEPTMKCADAPGWSMFNDDCDDSNPVIHGQQSELCDEIDNDCDGAVDEETGDVTWYEDGDGDGYGNPAGETMVACAMPDGFALAPTDCKDDDPDIHPGAMELCDAMDSDCSARGGVDPAEDFDGDGHADIGATCEGGPLPKDDCDDTDGDAYPGQEAFFTTEVHTVGGYDYNCDGEETPQLGFGQCYPRDGGGCTLYPGYYGPIPECGETGPRVSGCIRGAGGTCFTQTTEAPMPCR